MDMPRSRGGFTAWDWPVQGSVDGNAVRYTYRVGDTDELRVGRQPATARAASRILRGEGCSR